MKNVKKASKKMLSAGLTLASVYDTVEYYLYLDESNVVLKEHRFESTVRRVQQQKTDDKWRRSIDNFIF